MQIDNRASPLPAPERIVAIRPGALGDALLLFPTLALLRRAFRDTSITLVARPDVLPLARASALANQTSSYSDPLWSALFTDQVDEGSPTHDLLAGGVVLAWLADLDGSVARNMKMLGASRVFISPPLPPSSGIHEHMALQLAKALAPLSIETPTSVIALIDAMPSLVPPAEDEQQASAIWQRLSLPDSSVGTIAIHPGSGGATKRWPPKRFAALASAIHQMGYVPLLLEGPQDAEITSIVAEHAGVRLPIARNLTVGTLAALLRRCSAYIGNDSGVSHLAGLLGVRTLALFGPTAPTQWAPLGPQVQIERAPDGGLQQLGHHDVMNALAVLLSE